MLHVVEHFAVNKRQSRSFEFTLFSTACVSFYQFRRFALLLIKLTK